MSVAQIKSAVKSLKYLPEAKRKEVSEWVCKQIAHDTIHGRIKAGVQSGAFHAIMLDGMREYAEGKCLDRLQR